MYILGISAGHDAGAALVSERAIIAAAQEERFTRIKHFCGLPLRAIRFVIHQAGISPDRIEYIALPEEDASSDLLFYIADNMNRIGINRFRKIVPVGHHLAHAASAYRTSGWREATVITLDGMGDGLSGSVYHGKDGSLKKISEIGAGGSLGWFYSAVTEAVGFRPNDEEGKTMGLAAYGKAPAALVKRLETLAPRQSRLKLLRASEWKISAQCRDHFYRCHFDESREIRKLADKFGRENVAAGAQAIMEDRIRGLARRAVAVTGCPDLAVSGGVFYNVKVSLALESMACVRAVKPHPAAGDSGLCLGAALEAAGNITGRGIRTDLRNAYLGPSFSERECVEALEKKRIAHRVTAYRTLPRIVSGYLQEGAAVGWFQGRMEYGPRALGARSVLADPRNVAAKNRLNAKLKRREWFMPFAPTVLREHVDRYVSHCKPATSPFMIKAFKATDAAQQEIPAAVHVDGTVRVQTLERAQNPLFYDLIRRFYRDTSVPAVLNTSFNRHGLPIVCTPEDAVEHLEMGCVDVLVMNNVIAERRRDRKRHRS